MECLSMHVKLARSSGLKAGDFARLQKTVVTLRDDLIKATAEEG
jgi:MarR family transcriptional regulator, organic hydroperoxide resistance regulator